MEIKAINDFVIRFANVNGSGSASANNLFSKCIFRMGLPVSPKNIFPSNIQGLPTWYEVRVSEKGYLGRRAGVDIIVAVNPLNHRVYIQIFFNLRLRIWAFSSHHFKKITETFALVILF